MRDVKVHFHENDTTQMRLVKATQVLIATVGYDATSTRMITQLAGVNLSAINFHFGSKENLVKEAVTYAAKTYENWYKKNSDKATEFLSKKPVDKDQCWAMLEDYLRFKITDSLNYGISWMNVGIVEHENGLPESSRGIMAESIVKNNELIIAQFIMELSDHKDDFQAVLIARSIMASTMTFLEKPLLNEAFSKLTGVDLSDSKKVGEAYLKGAMNSIRSFVNETM